MNKQKILPSPAGLNHSVRQVSSMPSSSSSTAVSASFYSSIGNRQMFHPNVKA